MDTLRAAWGYVKGAYERAVGMIDDHPRWTFWVALAAVAVALWI